MNLVQILLIAAAFLYVMWRRLTGEPLQARRLALLPAILVIWGCSQLVRQHVTLFDVGLLAVEAVVALGLGLARGATIKVYETPATCGTGTARSPSPSGSRRRWSGSASAPPVTCSAVPYPPCRRSR